MDHTNCLQVAIKTHSFIHMSSYVCEKLLKRFFFVKTKKKKKKEKKTTRRPKIEAVGSRACEGRGKAVGRRSKA
jgi:hypothetical protein